MRRDARNGAAAALTEDVEHKANESVMSSQRQQDLVNQDHMFEVVYDALPVEEVHGRREPEIVQAFGGAQIACSAGDVGDGNDLLKGDHLDRSDDEDDVDMAHEKRGEEAADHDKRPESPRDEVGFLLLVF